MKALCEVSGGYDSALALVRAKQKGWDCSAVFVDYGQPYFYTEHKASVYVCEKLEVPWKQVRVDLKVSLPEGNSTASDYIPIRNLVLGSLLANHALSEGISEIVTGNRKLIYNEMDPCSFFDCTPAFYAQLESFVNQTSRPGHLVHYNLPLLENGIAMSKNGIVSELLGLGFDITRMWNCYGGGAIPCRQCRNCQEMVRVLDNLGVRKDYLHWWG